MHLITMTMMLSALFRARVSSQRGMLISAMDTFYQLSHAKGALQLSGQSTRAQAPLKPQFNLVTGGPVRPIPQELAPKLLLEEEFISLNILVLSLPVLWVILIFISS